MVASVESSPLAERIRRTAQKTYEARDLLAKAGIPIPLLSLAPLFVASYLSAKVFKAYLASDPLIPTSNEIQESSYAMLFALLAAMLHLGKRQDQIR